MASMNYVICMNHTDHVICMNYMDYVIYKNKKHLRIFLKFYFNARCISNMFGAPSKDWFLEITM